MGLAIPLTTIDVKLNDPVFDAIKTWPFTDEFVFRLLVDDIPQRIKYGSCQFWAYRDPRSTIVGFGTLAISTDCSEFADSKPHAYIPLLAVHPGMQGQGHGKSIVNHLVREAARAVARAPTWLHHALFLDVYEESTPAIRLYASCQFVTLNGPIVDNINGRKFFVMAKRVTP
jgi:ribosomal protein S18 acetylase RimI-like enzyme